MRVWDLGGVAGGGGSGGGAASGACVVLRGHLERTRALAWHHEVPFVLLSGSWDGCIRAWDIREPGSCLRVILDHHADVYGLASHPGRPLTFASSSRDTSLRLWTADSLTPGICLRAAVSADWAADGILAHDAAEIAAVMRPGAPARMCGAGSAKVAAEVADAGSDAAKGRLIAGFLLCPDGSTELGSVLAQAGSKVPAVEVRARAVHVNSVVSSLLAEAQGLEQSRGASFAGIGRQTKEECLRQVSCPLWGPPQTPSSPPWQGPPCGALLSLPASLELHGSLLTLPPQSPSSPS